MSEEGCDLAGSLNASVVGFAEGQPLVKSKLENLTSMVAQSLPC